MMRYRRTINASVVRLRSDLCYLTVLGQQSVSLAAGVPKYRCAVKGEIELRGKVSIGVTQKTDLDRKVRTEHKGANDKSPLFYRLQTSNAMKSSFKRYDCNKLTDKQF